MVEVLGHEGDGVGRGRVGAAVSGEGVEDLSVREGLEPLRGDRGGAALGVSGGGEGRHDAIEDQLAGIERNGGRRGNPVRDS